MNTFQFDKCLDDLELIEACHGENLVLALRLQEDLWPAKDPELLRVLMVRPASLIQPEIREIDKIVGQASNGAVKEANE
jgi:hypothetical protein